MKLVPMPSPPKGAAPFRQWMCSVLLGRDGHALLECEIEQSLAWHFDLISFGDDFRACAKSTTDLAPMPVPLPPPAIAFASRASFASSCHFNPVSAPSATCILHWAAPVTRQGVVSGAVDAMTQDWSRTAARKRATAISRLKNIPSRRSEKRASPQC